MTPGKCTARVLASSNLPPTNLLRCVCILHHSTLATRHTKKERKHMFRCRCHRNMCSKPQLRMPVFGIIVFRFSARNLVCEVRRDASIIRRTQTRKKGQPPLPHWQQCQYIRLYAGHGQKLCGRTNARARTRTRHRCGAAVFHVVMA